jgi:hypothetical protein
VGNKFGLVLVLVFALAGCAPPQTEVTPLTAEAKAYVPHLNLSGVQMKSTESYLKQSITEIEGNIQNQGDRALVSERSCAFSTTRTDRWCCASGCPS